MEEVRTSKYLDSVLLFHIIVRQKKSKRGERAGTFTSLLLFHFSS